jgi:exodeoxyribonuclease V
MKWSPQQDTALKAVNDWLRDPLSPQIFRLFGYAGTGKTTLAKHFASNVEGLVLFCAYTGKATQVLSKKGCPNTQTIHSLIYNPKTKSKAKIEELEQLIAKLLPDNIKRRKELERELEREKKNLSRPAFALNNESPIRNAALVVVDECSMVDARVGEDLLSFGKKILVLGDPAQLPPVASAGGFFTSHKPDFMLTEIHRQAAESPIIHLATKVRLGETLSLGDYGTSKIISKEQLVPGQLGGYLLDSEQVICGKNKTRQALNTKMRSLLGRPPECSPGEKVICLRNNKDMGLLNGAIWTVEDYMKIETDMAAVKLRDPDDTKSVVETITHTHYFEGREDQLSYWEKEEADQFDYGYAITTHKAQGSQWKNICVFDESHVFREHQNHWLYTAITRAEESIIIYRS